jgi:hypothetical protein
MNRDDLIANLNLPLSLTSTNFGKQVSKLQKLQTLLQRYQALKRYEEKLEEHNKAMERNKELEHFIKEWRSNRYNPDPDVDFGNGKVRITVWKAAPEDED